MKRHNLYYGGAWHEPHGGHSETFDPATGECIALVAAADAVDIDRAVQAARAGFETWRRIKPLERAALLRRVAGVLRANAAELAHLDALNAGNPVREMARDVEAAAVAMDYCAGLVTEVKGETIPMGEGIVNLSLREPYGVVARLVAYNHPLMFVAGKAAPALAVGNAVIMKPPEQAPLSALRMLVAQPAVG